MPTSVAAKCLGTDAGVMFIREHGDDVLNSSMRILAYQDSGVGGPVVIYLGPPVTNDGFATH